MISFSDVPMHLEEIYVQPLGMSTSDEGRSNKRIVQKLFDTATHLVELQLFPNYLQHSNARFLVVMHKEKFAIQFCISRKLIRSNPN